MKKHLFVVLALAAVAGVGLYPLAADPPAENKAPPQDSKAPAEEPKANTGEVAAQPSSGVDSDAEFNDPPAENKAPPKDSTVAEDKTSAPPTYEPDTSLYSDDDLLGLEKPIYSPGEIYAEMDPAFKKFTDLKLLERALADGDAALLADVVLGLAEGERILVRPHRGGFTADDLMVRTIKLAAAKNDAATSNRIVKAAKVFNKPKWADLVSNAAELGAASRAPGPNVPLASIDVSIVELTNSVRDAAMRASLTGEKGELEYLRILVAERAADKTVKEYLISLIESGLKDLPENQASDDVFHEFAAASRQFKLPKPPSIPLPKPPSIPLPKPPSIPLPKPPSIPTGGFTGYKTNKFDKMREVEAGGWIVAWSQDISETDAAQGVVAGGVSIYTGNPSIFYSWVDNLVQRTTNSLTTSAKNRFSAAARDQAKQLAAETIRAAIRGKNPTEVLRRYDTVDFKAGAIRYSGRNFALGQPVGPPTWGMKPYVAVRIR